MPDISRRGRDDFTNMLGTYTFPSLAAYEANQPALLLLQQGQGHLVFLETNLAGFLQDSWRVRPNLELTYGMRYYWQNYFHDDLNNFAPQANLAWGFGLKQAWVLRAGSGVFYDRTVPAPIASLLHFNGINLRRYLIDNPIFGNTNIAGTPTKAARRPQQLRRIEPPKLPLLCRCGYFTFLWTGGHCRSAASHADQCTIYLLRRSGRLPGFETVPVFPTRRAPSFGSSSIMNRRRLRSFSLVLLARSAASRAKIS